MFVNPRDLSMNDEQINGSIGVTEFCNNITDVEIGAYLFDYIEANSSSYPKPNSDYYENVYIPRFERINATLAKTLYYSECLELNFSTESPPYREWDNPNNPFFMYNDELLYNVEKDKIEACQILKNKEKKQELLNYLISRSEQYTVPITMQEDVNYGSLRAQLDSFDCNVTYSLPWNGYIFNLSLHLLTYLHML